VGEQGGAFLCRRCGATRALECLHDGGIAFRVVRPAIGRAREELAALAPRARVVAVDTASAPLPAFDVAVGTEAVLHRVRSDRGRPVELVAFLEFDQELLAPRYRAAEQALWLLVRAARLVGPRGGPGTVLVQSRSPGDPVLAAAGSGDPASVVGAERARRVALGFPPFGGLAEVAGDATAVETACDLLRDRIDVLGPNRGRALLRASSSGALADVLRAVDLAPARAVGRLRIDVDPLRV
jgi:primosomal protein N' (replication factor Y)